MTTLTIELRMVSAQNVQVTDEALIVDLSDGRTVSVPLAWFPRLLHGTPKERNNWRLIGEGEGIHWPDLDEDISVENLIFGNHPVRARSLLKSGWKHAKKVSSYENPEISENSGFFSILDLQKRAGSADVLIMEILP
jgi:hypothetical protein